jgi:hypothetical protein
MPVGTKRKVRRCLVLIRELLEEHNITDEADVRVEGVID